MLRPTGRLLQSLRGLLHSVLHCRLFSCQLLLCALLALLPLLLALLSLLPFLLLTVLAFLLLTLLPLLSLLRLLLLRLFLGRVRHLPLLLAQLHHLLNRLVELCRRLFLPIVHLFLSRLRQLVRRLLHGLRRFLRGLLCRLRITGRLLHLPVRRFAVLSRLLGTLRTALRIRLAQPLRQLIDVARERLVLTCQTIGLRLSLRCRTVCGAVGQPLLRLRQILRLVTQRLHAAFERGTLQHFSVALELFAQRLLLLREVIERLPRGRLVETLRGLLQLLQPLHHLR